jgi:hypothetical protein
MLVTGLAWLVALMTLLIFDLWRAVRRKPTLSQWVSAQDHRYPWFRWVILGLVAYLMTHFFC